MHKRLSQLYVQNPTSVSGVKGCMHISYFQVKCPEIQNQQDVMMIHDALAGSPGIDEVNVDVPSQTIHVSTANQDGGRDVMFRLDEAGFPCSRMSVR